MRISTQLGSFVQKESLHAFYLLLQWNYRVEFSEIKFGIEMWITFNVLSLTISFWKFSENAPTPQHTFSKTGWSFNQVSYIKTFPPSLVLEKIPDHSLSLNKITTQPSPAKIYSTPKPCVKKKWLSSFCMKKYLHNTWNKNPAG